MTYNYGHVIILNLIKNRDLREIRRRGFRKSTELGMKSSIRSIGRRRGNGSGSGRVRADVKEKVQCTKVPFNL